MAKSFAKFWGFFSKNCLPTEGIRCFKFFSFIFRRIFVVSLKPLPWTHQQFTDTINAYDQSIILPIRLPSTSLRRTPSSSTTPCSWPCSSSHPSTSSAASPPPSTTSDPWASQPESSRFSPQDQDKHRHNLFSKFIWRFRCILDERLLFFCPEETFRC